MIKKILTSILLTVSLFAPQALASFYDIDPRDPFYEKLQTLEERGIITSTPLENFSRESKITSDEYIEWVMRSIGVQKSNSQIPSNISVPNVNKDDSRALFIYKAAQMGIIDGSGFLENKGITRVKALQIAFKAEGIHVPQFVDANEWQILDVSHQSWFAPIVKRGIDMGIFANEGTFHPFKEITKEEAAKIIYTIQKDRRDYFESTIIEDPDSKNYKIDIYDKILDEQDIPEVDIFLHVYDSIRNEYLLNDQIEQRELINAAIKGMVSELSDPYSYYAEPQDDIELVNDLLSNELSGIGAEITERNGEVVIVAPIEGGPADIAGLLPNDVITAVDGNSVAGKSSSQVANLIRGESGTRVQVTIFRNTENREINVIIIREKFDVPSVKVKFDEEIAIITISLFRGNSVDQFEDAVQEVLASNPKGLILDVRNNTGGFLDASTAISSYFLPLGENIASVVDAKGNEVIYFSYGPSSLSEIPTVALINGGSASASEIIAGALQDHGQATIVGEQSFGKGSVQKLYNYYNGSEFKITVAKWLTPNGKNIDQVGVTPDVEVKRTIEDVQRRTDPQLVKALELLR